ncbi:MAG: type II toxin-antitoxin system RelE/ParE family toxin [Pyrinomonadaceae bacterium]
MKVRFHPEALAENIAAGRYYERQAIGLGRRYFDVIEKSARRIGNNPDLFPILDAPFRRLVILEFRYSLIYSIESDSALIVAVAHQSREPGYWKERLD